jgi:GTP-binding protein Era
MGTIMSFAEIVPISASKGINITALEQAVVSLLPLGPPLFPEDQLSDRDERFFASEIIREKLMRRLGQEVPYRLSVVIDQFVERENRVSIAATIWVERRGQKLIVIGKEGAVLKAVGEEARKDMERLFGKKVFLETWVKIKEQWSDDEQALRQMGYFSDLKHAR